MNKGIIVDANCFGENLRADVRHAVESGSLRIILPTRGKLHSEVRRANTEIYREYRRNRMIHFLCKRQVTNALRRLTHSRCRCCGVSRCDCITSDDEHVIATAIVSRANVIVSNDEELMSDFENCKDIDLKFGGTDSTEMPNSKQRRIITCEKSPGDGAKKKSATHKAGTPVRATQNILKMACFSAKRIPCDGNPKLCQGCPF